jgi:uncharacterized phage-associated protein
MRNLIMAHVFDVADFLLHLSAMEDEPEYLTEIRLQKLLYYAQAWFLVFNEAPLFDTRIEAWAHGPTIAEIHKKYSHIGPAGIPPEKEFGERLTEAEKEFLFEIWDTYKKYSAWSLRDMATKEAPWIQARGKCGPADRCDNEVTHESLKSYFDKLLEKEAS